MTLLEAKAVLLFMRLGYCLSEVGVHISIFNWIQGNFPKILVHTEQPIGETFEMAILEAWQEKNVLILKLPQKCSN